MNFEPVLSRVLPVIVAVAALLTALGIWTSDDAQRWTALAGAVLSLAAGAWAAWSARAKVTPVVPNTDGTFTALNPDIQPAAGPR